MRSAIGVTTREWESFHASQPTTTFDLNHVLDPVIDRLAQDHRGGGAYEIKCEVRWNPARRCLPELVIDAPRIVLLARDEARLDLRLVRRDPPATSPPAEIEPLIRVEFTVRGTGFDPMLLSEAIGARPDLTTRADPAHPKRLDTWTRDSGPIRGSEFTAPLNALLQDLMPRASRIREFCASHGARATLAFVTEVVNQAPHLTISARQFRDVAALGASIWFDPYCVPELDESKGNDEQEA